MFNRLLQKLLYKSYENPKLDYKNSKWVSYMLAMWSSVHDSSVDLAIIRG